jgi:hypothetical protein
MSTVTDLSATLEDQVLGTLSFAQGIALDAVRSVAGAVEPVIPKDLPFADQLPSAAEVADAGFSLVEKVVQSQHQFVKNLLGAAPKPSTNGKAAAKAS